MLFGQNSNSEVNQIALILFSDDSEELYQQIDSAFNQIENINIIDRSKVIHAVYHNDTTSNILSAIVNQKKLNKLFKKNKSISKYVSDNEIVFLRKRLDNSEYILLPNNIELKTIQKVNGDIHQTIKGNLILFDLNKAIVLANEKINHKIPIEDTTEMNIAITRKLVESFTRITNQLIRK